MDRVQTTSAAFGAGFSGASLFVLLMAGAAPAGASGGSERVANGITTQDRPTTGALLYTFGINYQLLCSGTLIGCDTFLTAAHCVCGGLSHSSCGVPPPGNFSVYLQDVGIVAVRSISVDPTFSFRNEGDVAVLKLAVPVTGVSPTAINTTRRAAPGTRVEMAGYGLTVGGGVDVGLLRRGSALTSTCTAADDDHHVCWAFAAPVGMPGLDSNTCNGDSGGPLFADLGAGNRVIGITSGGTSPDCLPTDASFDTDVYVHRAFIEDKGGEDLANTRCGAAAQVGEAGVSRATFSFDTFSSAQQSCRKRFTKELQRYAAAALGAAQGCAAGIADGSHDGPCPDGTATLALLAARSRVDVDKVARKCPDAVVRTMGTRGVCSDAATAGDLVACIFAAGDASTREALRLQYANGAAAGSIDDPAGLRCQGAVARASAVLLRSTLKAASTCQVALANGRGTSCPDASALAAFAKAEAGAAVQIASACPDAAIASLHDNSGGSCEGAATAVALGACHADGDARIRDDLVGLLHDESLETDLAFTVPPGTTRLRVTLNGRDSGANDLDLFVRAGLAATKTTHDGASENGGTFEGIEIAAPAAGTWYARIAHWSGDPLIPWQLTATSFQP